MLVLHDWNIKKRQRLARVIAYTSSKIAKEQAKAKITKTKENQRKLNQMGY